MKICCVDGRDKIVTCKNRKRRK